jgi:arginyl-tRNA synthetase
MGALKFFMIKVNPKKKMIFQPGGIRRFAGPNRPVYPIFLRSDQRPAATGGKGTALILDRRFTYTNIQAQEKELLKALHEYPGNHV